RTVSTVPGSISDVGWSLGPLATTVSPWVGRVIVDRTELAGLFDFELAWTPDQPIRPPDDAPPVAIDPNGPSIFTALQEQLGLKLESARGPVDVVVIDNVRRPSPDSGSDPYARLRLGAAAALTFSTTAFAGAFFLSLTRSRLLRSASMRLTTFGGSSTSGAITSRPAIFASMISCRPS